ncbi:MAG: hypothetical protein ACREKL_03975 [Chthoniobacterales bacterium]
MFLQILISVAIEALVTVALLLVVRNRVARQFDDIERRLAEVERTAHALRTGAESSTITAQLQRLHLGMVRLHEDVAQRYGPLAPLAEELAQHGPVRIHLGAYQLAGLREWADRLGVPLEEEQIRELGREVGKMEGGNRDVSTSTHELLAAIIALLPLHGQRGLKLGVAGAPSQLVGRVASEFLESSTVSPADNSSDCDIVIAEDEASSLGALKSGGMLVTIGGDAPEELPKELALVDAAWNVRVYRKATP